MKLLIAGSRHIDMYQAYYAYDCWINEQPGRWIDISEFVTGDCPTGPDQVPYLVWNCLSHLVGDPNFAPPAINSFPAQWEKYGKYAGPKRNRKMAEYADALLLIWDGKSKGSSSMKREMKRLKKPIWEVIINDNCSTSSR